MSCMSAITTVAAITTVSSITTRQQTGDQLIAVAPIPSMSTVTATASIPSIAAFSGLHKYGHIIHHIPQCDLSQLAHTAVATGHTGKSVFTVLTIYSAHLFRFNGLLQREPKQVVFHQRLFAIATVRTELLPRCIWTSRIRSS